MAQKSWGYNERLAAGDVITLISLLAFELSKSFHESLPQAKEVEQVLDSFLLKLCVQSLNRMKCT